MAVDFQFNCEDREIITDSLNEDFVIGTPASTGLQNGFIMLSTTCVNYNNPIFGINIQKSINVNSDQKINLMSNWSNLCRRDGAILAQYKILPNTNPEVGGDLINITTQYV